MRVAVAEVLRELGGVVGRAELLRSCLRAEVDGALRSGELVILARGRYALADADDARRAAHRLAGVVSHESAALLWGWPVKVPPPEPHITIGRSRVLTPEQRRGVVPHWAALHPDDIAGRVTSKERTLLDCLRLGDQDAALAVADSALREGESASWLAAIGRDARGPGSAQTRRIAAMADGKAANPFESVLRGIASRVEGLRVRPQVPIFSGDSFLGQPDLVDTDLRIVLEADSFEWHGDRAALRRDCRRYDRLVAAGWLVLRFAWEDVMFDATWVTEILEAVVHQRAHQPFGPPAAA